MLKILKFGTKSRNLPILFISYFFSGLLFFLPILTLYYEESLFNATNVAIIYSVQGFALALFEVPTGAIADLFGRKNTLILAYILRFAALFFLYFGSSMTLFIIYSLIKSLGRSLASGTDKAMVYDILKAEKKEKIYKKVIGNYEATWAIGATIGSIIGGYLATFSLSLPILLTFGPLLISIILALFLIEVPYEKEDHKNVLKHMWNSVKIIMHSKQLFTLMTGGFILIGFGASIHLLNPLFLKYKEIPLEMFGVLASIIFGFASLGFYLSHYVAEKIGNKNSLLLAVFVAPLLYLISTLTPQYVSMVFFLVAAIFFGLRNPIIDHMLNDEVSSKERATVLSIGNFFNQLGLSIVSILVGYWADLYNINTAFMLASSILFIVPILYFVFLEDSAQEKASS